MTTSSRGGVFSFAADGSFVYSLLSPLPSGFSDVDTFTYHSEYGALVSNEADVTLRIPGLFRLHPFHAISRIPYIYVGCPDPGPEPWREVLEVSVGTNEPGLEVYFPSAVPLGIHVESEGRGRVVVGPQNQLVYFPPGERFEHDVIGVAIEDASCHTTHHASIDFVAQ